MPITIRGEGSIEGLSAGGLPDASVTAATFTLMQQFLRWFHNCCKISW